MKFRILTTLVLWTAAFAACSDAEREPAPDSAPGTTRVVLKQNGAQDLAVYAFRQEGDLFRYKMLFRDGWSPDGRLSVRMPSGRYKFLFASGEGANLSLEPAPLTPQTTWEEALFTLHESTASGVYSPADELFLQYPSTDAERIHTLSGTDLTVAARLTRAVGRIDVQLMRGYHNGTQYIEEPYAAPHSVLDEIERIEIRAENAGLRVRPDAVSGEAVVTATLPAADYAELSPEGFALLKGPLILPPAGGADLRLTLKVVPAAGSALKPVELPLTGKAERNKSLVVTLWITSGYPRVQVEIGLGPITEKQEGDSGIWE